MCFRDTYEDKVMNQEGLSNNKIFGGGFESVL
jgi:hypothetical protein